MPDIIDTEFELERLFGADGLIHQAPRQNLTPRYYKRRNQMRPEDPYVCLSCTSDSCDGTRECYIKRKKAIEAQTRRQNHEEAEKNPA